MATIDFTKPLEEPKEFTLKDVEDNQFFKDSRGELCQKIDYQSYNTLADSKGILYSETVNCVDEDEPIQKIYPHITHIKFD